MQGSRELEVFIALPTGTDRVSALGEGERNLKMVREGLGVSVSSRDGQIRIAGEREAVFAARTVVERVIAASQGRRTLSRAQVLEVISEESARHRAREAWLEAPARDGGNGPVGGGDAGSGSGSGAEAGVGWKAGMPAWEGELAARAAGRTIRAQTERQAAYVEAMRTNDLVFGIGPAGTGKTYLAVAVAVHMLRIERVRKVVLARPAVEAGEKLGFLPGDLEAKINPYLRPLFDALHDMMDYSTIRRLLDSDVLEVVPLAFMRGRTLNHAVIILDEAQNTTRGQMQMFLTRMGHGSKMIVTGDTTQIDLPDPTASGLIDAARRLRRVAGVAIAALDRRDVVRHSLVQRIVEAYGETGGASPPVADAGGG